MKKGDKVVISVLIFVILIGLIGIFTYRKINSGNKLVAVIKQDGKVVKKIDLNNVKKDTEIKIKSKDNHYNIIEVGEKKIRFKSADCQNQICVKSGWIKHPGDSVACLPHKVLIVIQGKNREVDDVSY